MPTVIEKIKIFVKEGGIENMGTGVEKPYNLISKLSAEFVGTLLFIFIGSLSALKSDSSNVITHAAFAHGLTIFVLVNSFGHISGGHFNPAVTLAVTLAGRAHPYLLIPYWIVQLLGGLVGAILVRATTQIAEYERIMGGATILSDDHWYQGLIAEAVLTVILTTVVLMCAVDTKDNFLAPLAIGMAVTLDIFGAGSISGASMNPARSAGPCIAAALFLNLENSGVIWTYHYIYYLGPFIGATISALLYRTLFSRSNRLLV